MGQAWLGLQLSFECFVQDGGQQGIQLGGGLGLQALQRVHLRLQCVQLGHEPALFGEWGDDDVCAELFVCLKFPRVVS